MCRHSTNRSSLVETGSGADKQHTLLLNANPTPREQWYTLATLLDKLFFMGFFISLIFLMIYVFPSPASLFEL